MASFAGPDEEFNTKYIVAHLATPEKPFQNTTTPQYIELMLWSAYKNND
jgi:lipopolysaccharide biosynthesis glycosyltransferase